MSNPRLQVINQSILTDRFRELLSVPDNASDLQISVGIHATKISYKIPFVEPQIAAQFVVKKKPTKKKDVKKND